MRMDNEFPWLNVPLYQVCMLKHKIAIHEKVMSVNKQAKLKLKLNGTKQSKTNHIYNLCDIDHIRSRCLCAKKNQI